MSEHVHSTECKNLLGELSDYIDGELRAELCAEIEKHLQTCENCRIVVNTLRKTVELYEQTCLMDELPQSTRERLYTRLNLDEYLKKA
jgi:anti-sigma factor (TIGR02949 family)